MVNDEKIKENSMKLYSYLICISCKGSSENQEKIFQQKNLMLSKIKLATGITDKTVKIYLYYLEKDNLIRYMGDIHHEYEGKDGEIYPYVLETDFDLKTSKGRTEYKKAIEKTAFKTWTDRAKNEKNGYYRVVKSTPYTPIPRETLIKLNEEFEATELEYKIYILCCRYRDICAEMGKEYKNLTFEDLRTVLDLKKHTDTNSAIRRALYFLRGIGLIEFIEGVFTNRKGAEIPCFRLKEVNYYIILNKEKIEETSLEAEEVRERLSELTINLEDTNGLAAERKLLS